MATFTSSLPDELLERLSETAQELKLPKNKLIEKALEIFLDEIKRAKYAKSYKKAAQDEEIMQIAEEGMADYFRMIEDFEKK
jgi:predicted transcriptional regulator